MKKLALLFSLLLLLPVLGGCGKQKYTNTAYDLFDTEITLLAACDEQSTFDEMWEICIGRLKELNRAFDIYNPDPDGNNLCTVNAAAGQGPVEVSEDILELLSFGKEAYQITGGQVNIAMGSVLSIWHDARENTHAVPEMAALRAAAEHCDPAGIVINWEMNTVYLADGEMQLDVGAIAKGWAAQQAVKALEAAGYTDFVLSAGGNVVARGVNTENKAWTVGIQDPDNTDTYFAKMSLNNKAAVTSGGYLRYLEVDGVKYHHIIDPDTLMPADFVKSATVISKDSGLADALSTACFLMPAEDAMALADQLNVQVIVMDQNGKIYNSKEN